jgi:hypothetical protein
MKKVISKAENIVSFAKFLDLLLDDSADRIYRALRWTKQEFTSVDIITPWLSMLIYHLGG